MTANQPAIEQRIAVETEIPPPVFITEVAERICQRFGSRVAGVLAYGSCLRDSSPEETLIDMYVLLHKAADVSTNLLSQAACRVLPPNVYYGEYKFGERTFRAKYAAMSLQSFAANMTASAMTPYFWGRFSQPSRVVYVADETCRQVIISALARACRTMFHECLKLAEAGDDALMMLERGLKASYATELRAERIDRPKSLLTSNRLYYQELADLVLGPDFRAAANGNANWKTRIVVGKLMSISRLIKAGFTFDGGAEYVAWKVRRHSGEPIDLKPWQRRHPILMAITLLPRLLKKGAVR